MVWVEIISLLVDRLLRTFVKLELTEKFLQVVSPALICELNTGSRSLRLVPIFIIFLVFISLVGSFIVLVLP